MDNDNIITDAIKAEIEKKVKELKAADPKLKKVYPIVVEGDEGDDKEYYIGYFKRPNFTQMSKFLTAVNTSSNPTAMRALAQDCFVDGDKQLVDDDDLFMFGTLGQLGGIIEARHGKLVNLSKPGK